MGLMFVPRLHRPAVGEPPVITRLARAVRRPRPDPTRPTRPASRFPLHFRAVRWAGLWAAYLFPTHKPAQRTAHFPRRFPVRGRVGRVLLPEGPLANAKHFAGTLPRCGER